MSEQAYWSETVSQDERDRHARIAALRAELVLLGSRPDYELLILESKQARLMSLLVHHALGRVDFTDQELEQVREFETVLKDKHWLMAVPSSPRKNPAPRWPGDL